VCAALSCQVMLDCGLAALYGVETKNLNKAVRRNLDRFPADFMSHFNLIPGARTHRLQGNPGGPTHTGIGWLSARCERAPAGDEECAD